MQASRIFCRDDLLGDIPFSGRKQEYIYRPCHYTYICRYNVNRVVSTLQIYKLIFNDSVKFEVVQSWLSR